MRDIAPGGRGRSGRLKEIVLTYATKTGSLAKRPIGPDQEIRTALRDDFLRSSAIVVDLKKDKKGVIEVATFHGAGWGHGVGLCQIGGLGRAQLGQSYKQNSGRLLRSDETHPDLSLTAFDPNLSDNASLGCVALSVEEGAFRRETASS